MRRSFAVGETAILLHPPSTFSRCFNSDGERGCQQNDSLADGWQFVRDGVSDLVTSPEKFDRGASALPVDADTLPIDVRHANATVE